MRSTYELRKKMDVWAKKLRRRIETDENDDVVTVLHTGQANSRYIVLRHIVESLPPESRRPNWLNSELVLAFPITDFTEMPHVGLQNVYAILPIKSYGFKVGY